VLGKQNRKGGKGWAYLTGAHRHQTPNGDLTYGGGAASPVVAAGKERQRVLARVKRAGAPPVSAFPRARLDSLGKWGDRPPVEEGNEKMGNLPLCKFLVLR